VPPRQTRSDRALELLPGRHDIRNSVLAWKHSGSLRLQARTGDPLADCLRNARQAESLAATRSADCDMAWQRWSPRLHHPPGFPSTAGEKNLYTGLRLRPDADAAIADELVAVLTNQASSERKRAVPHSFKPDHPACLSAPRLSHSEHMPPSARGIGPCHPWPMSPRLYGLCRRPGACCQLRPLQLTRLNQWTRSEPNSRTSGVRGKRPRFLV